MKIELPRELKQILAQEKYAVDQIGMSTAQVLLFGDKVLKIQPDSKEAQTECSMMKWLEGKLPAPKCLFHTVENGISYLLMKKVEGKMACDEDLMKNPLTLISALADSMKVLWETDISECPVRWTLEARLEEARIRVFQGLVDTENCQEDTYGPGGFKDPEALLYWLEQNRPEEDVVLSHGDFCLPNVFLQNYKLSGFIDLGRMGAGDRWNDIALCWRSLKDNYGGKYGGQVYDDFDVNILLTYLDIKPDTEKLRYYILLDELF